MRVPTELQAGTQTILDGRCRFLAAGEAKLTHVPVIDAPLNGDDPVVYILRMASKRRHLSVDQRAMLADEERKWVADENKRKRASKAGAAGGRSRPKNSLADTPTAKLSGETKERDRSTDARESTARAHNVPSRKVKQAQAVKEASPELAEKVKNGEVPLAQAARRVARIDSRPPCIPPAADSS